MIKSNADLNPVIEKFNNDGESSDKNLILYVHVDKDITDKLIGNQRQALFKKQQPSIPEVPPGG